MSSFVMITISYYATVAGGAASTASWPSSSKNFSSTACLGVCCDPPPLRLNQDTRNAREVGGGEGRVHVMLVVPVSFYLIITPSDVGFGRKRLARYVVRNTKLISYN